MANDKKSLYTWCIENNLNSILDEWDYEKNGNLTPQTISYGSSKKVFWKCHLKHSWEGEVKGRATKGRKCPICSNDKVLIGYNDFQTWCNQHNATLLLEEWDFEKNIITPKEVVFGYRKPIWWKCHNGHSFQKNIRYRIGLSGEIRNCPYCRGIRIVSGDKSLGTVTPHLLEEWDYDKNKNSPNDYTYGSSEYAWWKCKKCGHSWNARISHRVNGVGCPPCSYKEASKKLMIPDDGQSLLDLFPDLCKEWHPTKNNNLSPASFKPNSNKKVWWLCSACGTEWETAIGHRSQGKGCPKCMNEQRRNNFMEEVIERQGSLADNYPDLIEEWDFERNNDCNPTQMSCGSEEKVWWKCKTCGHSWNAMISRRTKRKQGCPECRKELRTSFPEKAVYFYIKKIFDDAIENYRPDWLGKAEIDIFIPSIKVGIEYDGSAYHGNIEKDLRKNVLCKERGIKLLRIREPKCPILNDSSIDFQMFSYKQNDFEITLSQLVEWIRKNYIISIVPIIELEKDKGHIYELMNLQAKVNSLMKCFPDVASEWHPIKNAPLTPEKVSSKSNRKVWWVCTNCGHEWQATIGSRSNGTGCPCCAQDNRVKSLERYAIATKGSLLEQNPSKAAEWHPTKNGTLSPADVTEYSNKKVWWLCSEHGHEWKISVNQKKNCPYCNNRKSLEGFNDLTTTRPDLITEWHPTKNTDLTPAMVMKGSHRKIWWLCSTCGHEWETSVKNRDKGCGCPKCGIKRAVKTRTNKREIGNI